MRDESHQPSLRLLSPQSVCELADFSRGQLYRLIAIDPTFPRPIKIGRSTRFAEAAVREWIDGLIAASKESPPKLCDTSAATNERQRRRKRSCATPS